jgi:hypothetical protein
MQPKEFPINTARPALLLGVNATLASGDPHSVVNLCRSEFRRWPWGQAERPGMQSKRSSSPTLHHPGLPLDTLGVDRKHSTQADVCLNLFSLLRNRNREQIVNRCFRPVVTFSTAGFRPFSDSTRKGRGDGWTRGRAARLPLISLRRRYYPSTWLCNNPYFWRSAASN